MQWAKANNNFPLTRFSHHGEFLIKVESWSDAKRSKFGLTFDKSSHVIILKCKKGFSTSTFLNSLRRRKAHGKVYRFSSLSACTILTYIECSLAHATSRKSSIQINCGKLRSSITWTVEDVRPIKVKWKRSACWACVFDEYFKLYIRALNFQFPPNFWVAKKTSSTGAE